MPIPGIVSIGGMGTAKLSSYAFQGTASSSTNASSYTFSSQPFGSAASDRIVIVGIAGNSGSSSISSVTIGGVNATIVVQSTGSLNIAIAAAAVPTGTTGSVVVTFSVGKSSCGIGIWSATGQITASGVASGSNVDLSEITISAEPGGFAIGVAANTELEAPAATSWTGASEDFDIVSEFVGFSGASAATPSSSVSVDPALSFNPFNDAFILATF
jgi:hypothetical protein